MHETMTDREGGTVRAQAILQKVINGHGSCASLNAEEKAEYYLMRCRSLGLNPMTGPLEYTDLNGKLVLYTKKDATEQLRKLHGVSTEIVSQKFERDLCIVHARAKDRHGRTDESIGALSINGLKGDALANALMKCETKAKRRVTLSLCGLGDTDESELETVPGYAFGGSAGASEAPDARPTWDQVQSLFELVRSCGVEMATFGNELRQVMGLTPETKISRQYLTDHMTLAQFEAQEAHYQAVLKSQVEEAIGESGAADVTTTEADDTPSESPQEARSDVDEGSDSREHDARTTEAPEAIPDDVPPVEYDHQGYATPVFVKALRERCNAHGVVYMTLMDLRGKGHTGWRREAYEEAWRQAAPTPAASPVG